MRGALAVASVLLLLAGCTTPDCFYLVQWSDATLVDLLPPHGQEGQIPLEDEGLSPALQGATVVSVEWREGGSSVRAEHGSISVWDRKDVDDVLHVARDLLAAFTHSTEAELDALVESLAANRTDRWASAPDGGQGEPLSTYVASLDVAWDVRGFLDAHLEEVPATQELHVGGYDIRISPRVSRLDEAGLVADGFGRAWMWLPRDRDGDNRPEVLEEEARRLLAEHGLPQPEAMDAGESSGC